MYRVSPLTYLIGGMLSTGLGNVDVHCSKLEITLIQPPNGTTCGDYMAPYLQLAGGEVYNPTDKAGCQYCQISNSDMYLAAVSVYYDERWRNFGLVWAYVAFNIFAALFFYWFARVRGSPSLSQTAAWILKACSILKWKKEQM